MRAWLERVRNGEELVVKDRNTPIARFFPPAMGEDLDVGEAEMVAAGLMRLPLDEKNDDCLAFRRR